MAKTTASAALPATSQQPQNNDLPLFFKRPTALDARRHTNAGLAPTEDMAYATNTNSIFINSVEFAETAKHYPIVFSQAELPMPAALTGLESKNYYIGEDKQWKKGTYIPAYVRRYPFVFLELPEQERFALCVDEDATQFRNKIGKDVMPFFTDGKPSALTRNALDFCQAFQQQYEITREFCAALKKAELLTPTRSDAKLNNGREVQLSGFQVIDEAKFNKLSDDTILEFHKKGWLPLIYFVLLSASNWRGLVSLATEAEKA